MGKTKQKKFKAPKPKPTGLPSVKDSEKELEDGIADDPQNESLVDESVRNYLEKLGSPNEEDREWSCTSIANLVSQPATAAALLKNNIVKILGPLILDHSLQVRHKALGALRNLSVDGGSEACEEMVRRDVLTPLVSLFQQYGQGWTPEQASGKRQTQLKSEIFDEATHVLWNLCESCEEAVNVFNKENLISCLWPCLQHTVYGLSLSVTVAQCLHTVTEDNNELAVVCRAPDRIAELQSLMTGPSDTAEQVLFKTLITGILVNISGGELPTAPGSMVSAILSSVSDVLAIDALAALQTSIAELKQDIENSLNEDKKDGKGFMESENNKFSEKMSNIKNILAAQQVALEIVANLCCSDDEEWEDLNSSESSSDDLNADTEMEEDDPSANNFISPLCVPSEIHSAIVKHDIFTKVLNKSQPLDLTQLNIAVFEKQLKKSAIFKSFDTLQTHGLLCINNLVSSMEVQDLGGMDNLHNVWQGLVQLSTSQQVVQNPGKLEAVTSAMRAVVQKLAELESPKLSAVEPKDLQFLYELGQQCTQSEVKVHTIRIISTIGCLLAKQTDPHPMLKNVGMFLLEIVCRDGDLWVVAEALDSIFDVFGEDHLDPIVKEIHLTERLKQVLPPLKAKINSSKHSLGEHYPIISTAKANLIRFIKYKASH